MLLAWLRKMARKKFVQSVTARVLAQPPPQKQKDIYLILFLALNPLNGHFSFFLQTRAPVLRGRFG
jgi:hypothetical protein